MAGPPPKPVELQRRLGNPGHRPLPERSEPVGAEVLPDVPPPEGLHPIAEAHWREIVPVLFRHGGVREVDLPALKALCVAWARMELTSRVLDQAGYFAQGSTGQAAKHPAWDMWVAASGLYLRYAQEFGLTWIARSRLGLNEATRESIQRGIEQHLGANSRAVA